ncbi:MAG: hypothetical protein AAGG99_04315 [Pseudomonadota bacterium]
MADVRTAPPAENGSATTQRSRSASDVADLSSQDDLPSLRIYAHSTLFYWWPVWLSGYIMAAYTYVGGGEIALDQVRNEWFHESSTVGVTFVAIMMLVIVFTNLKLRGIYSVVLGLVVALIAVSFAWLQVWDDILEFIPQLSVHMNAGFYLVFSTLLFAVWLLTFLIFDRTTYYRIVPGQLTVEHMIGGGEESYDTRGMLFQQKSDDFFRHRVLGFGSGDLELNVTGAKEATLVIPNVLFAGRKVRAIQHLISVEPDSVRRMA